MADPTAHPSVIPLAVIQVLCLTAVGCPVGYESHETCSVGHTDQYSIGELRLWRECGVLVGRDEEGLYCMTAACSLDRCIIGDEPGEIDGDGAILCKCHDDIYARTGEMAGGPPDLSLVHFDLIPALDGSLECDVNEEVPRSTRVD